MNSSILIKINSEHISIYKINGILNSEKYGVKHVI